MFCFTSRRVLWQTLMIGVSFRILLADEPGPTLKEFVRQAPDPERDFTSPSAAVRFHLSFHGGPQWGKRRHLLVISWFQGNGRTALRYTVKEDGLSEDVRDVYNHALQAGHQRKLSPDDLKRLSALLPTLPGSKAEPPIERTLHVSFQSLGKWRTETYDTATLPHEIENVMQVLGERFGTKDRAAKTAD